MTVKQLRAFLAVAQSLSFAQAGERLHLSQPALSLAIKSLEGKPRRSAAGTYHPQRQPHPEGETLLPLALRLLADWDNTEELLRQHFPCNWARSPSPPCPPFAGNLRRWS